MSTPQNLKKKSNPVRTQPLSAASYAVIALLGLLLAAGFTVFYVNRVPQLVQAGVQGQMFYLLLLPWGLSCAVFLFGAMKSYAKFAHKHLGSALELGGPAVLFCLVLVGGFKLVPAAPETFDLAVRAYSKASALLTSGQVTLDLPGLPSAKIGPGGEANFKGISTRFRANPIRVLVQAEGYEENWYALKPENDVLDVELHPASPVVTLTGSIVPLSKLVDKTRILVDGQDGDASPDALGRFKLKINGKPGDRVRVKVYFGTRQVYDDYQILPGPVTLVLHGMR